MWLPSEQRATVIAVAAGTSGVLILHLFGVKMSEHPGVKWGRLVSRSARRTNKIVELLESAPAMREDHVERILSAVSRSTRLTDADRRAIEQAAG